MMIDLIEHLSLRNHRNVVGVATAVKKVLVLVMLRWAHDRERSTSAHSWPLSKLLGCLLSPRVAAMPWPACLLFRLHEPRTNLPHRPAGRHRRGFSHQRHMYHSSSGASTIVRPPWVLSGFCLPNKLPFTPSFCSNSSACSSTPSSCTEPNKVRH